MKNVSKELRDLINNLTDKTPEVVRDLTNNLHNRIDQAEDNTNRVTDKVVENLRNQLVNEQKQTVKNWPAINTLQNAITCRR